MCVCKYFISISTESSPPHCGFQNFYRYCRVSPVGWSEITPHEELLCVINLNLALHWKVTLCKTCKPQSQTRCLKTIRSIWHPCQGMWVIKNEKHPKLRTEVNLFWEYSRISLEIRKISEFKNVFQNGYSPALCKRVVYYTQVSQFPQMASWLQTYGIPPKIGVEAFLFKSSNDTFPLLKRLPEIHDSQWSL